MAPTARSAFLRDARHGAWLLFLLACVAVIPATPVRAEDKPKPDKPKASKPASDEPAPDKQVGTVDVKVKPKPKTPPDDPEAAKRILDRARAIGGEALDWHAAYVKDPDGKLSPAAAATLALARDTAYGRAQAVNDLSKGGERVKSLVRNLDVGRHELLKHIYHRAMILANERLKGGGLSELQKLQAVNAGGTGDYTRDQDITVFAGDPEREKAFFEAVEFVAREELHLKTDVKPTGGIDFPEIEVTFFKGSNDLPDARFATDVEDFAIKYEKAIANQAADREAYKGGGAFIEVGGRRVPGAMYVQQFTWEDGKPVYRAETPQNFREASSLFSGTAPERWARFERAAHIFSDFVQGRQHTEGEHHDVSKGPLKYAGRGIEHLCQIYGMKPWPELKMADRIALLRREWPHLDPKTGQGERVFRQVAEAIDMAVYVKVNKKLPDGADPVAVAKADKIALGFLRNATGTTVSQMARDMLVPPAFDVKEMRRVVGPAWDSMTPVKRFAFARERDATFRAATSRASMENLLVAVSLLRNMDFQDGKLLADRPGEHLLGRLTAEADSETRVVLTLASEYAEAWARKQQTADPKVRAECDQKLAALRKTLVVHCPLAPTEMPSVALLRKAAADGPRAVMQAEAKPGRTWLSPAALEVKQAFMEHLKQAFPSQAEEWADFRTKVAENGKAGYIGRRLAEEAFQWDTVADALTMVEMYQEGAGREQFETFLAINLVSRIHWGVGPLIQALQVYDKDPTEAAKKFKELGKSLVFMTLSRIVPWAASVKIGFDVMRGTVVVTVGWAIGQANAALVDAIYTGEAGRTNEEAAGKAWGRIRDFGDCVIPAEHVVRRDVPKSTKFVIDVDRDGVYLDFFKRFTDADGDDVPRPSPPRADAAAFVTAHDTFVRILRKQAEQHGATWVPDPDKPFVPLKLGEKEVEDAIRALEPHLRTHAAREVDRVLGEIAVRQYRSYVDAEGTDVIREALVNRFSSDLLGGLIEHWQVRLTAEILAARDLERTAMFQDWSVIAAALHEKYVPSPTRVSPLEVRLQGGRMRAVRRPDGSQEFVDPKGVAGDGSGVEFRVKAKADGVPVLDGAALDGGQPVRLSVSLEGRGACSDTEKPVKFEVTTKKLKKLRKVGEADDDGPVGAGDIAEDVITIRALAADGEGPELASTEIVLRVLIPEAEGVRPVPLYLHEEKRRDGRSWLRYRYVKPFYGMPETWVADGTEVYHGDYETFLSDGKTVGEIRRYRFGVLHGTVEDFDSKGRLVHEVPYVDGVTEGDDVRRDPDGPATRVYRYVKGKAVEQTVTGSKGLKTAHITYETVPNPVAGEPDLFSGKATGWWPNGQVCFQGAYAFARPDLNSMGGPAGQEIPGKDGLWEWFFADGQLLNRTTFRRGVRDGPYETWNFALDIFERPDVATDRKIQDGDQREVGAYANGVRVGTWSLFDWKGRPLGSVDYEGGKPVKGEKITWHPNGKRAYQGRWTLDGEEGVCVTFFENGGLSRSATYARGVGEGAYERRFENGQVSEQGAYHANLKEGRWKTFFGDGALREEGSYVADAKDGAWSESGGTGNWRSKGSYKMGSREGRWDTIDAKGKRSWEEYREGRLVGSGREK